MQNQSSTGLSDPIAGVLCYVAGFITGIIFLLIEKESKFVRYHAIQSILLSAAYFVISLVLSNIPFIGWLFGALFGLVGLGVWLFCMYKAYQGEWFEFPWIGKIAREQLNRM